jgi:hypothetical protein
MLTKNGVIEFDAALGIIGMNFKVTNSPHGRYLIPAKENHHKKLNAT